MDEELRGQAPDHEPVPDDAAEHVTRLAAAAIAPGRMPALYLGHGAPPLVDDPLWVVQLEAWARALPRPAAILVVSAHWEPAPLTIAATIDAAPAGLRLLRVPRALLPRHLPAARRARPGRPDPRPAGRPEPVADQPDRGLDHGAYVPLTVMYPEADIPVLQISMPSLDPDRLLRIGAALRPLRDEGILIIGSGFLTHGLPFLRDFRFDAPPPGWSAEFDTGPPRRWTRATSTPWPACAARPPPGTRTHRRALRPAVRHPGRRAEPGPGQHDHRLLAGPGQKIHPGRLAPHPSWRAADIWLIRVKAA